MQNLFLDFGRFRINFTKREICISATGAEKDEAMSDALDKLKKLQNFLTEHGVPHEVCEGSNFGEGKVVDCVRIAIDLKQKERPAGSRGKKEVIGATST